MYTCSYICNIHMCMRINVLYYGYLLTLVADKLPTSWGFFSSVTISTQRSETKKYHQIMTVTVCPNNTTHHKLYALNVLQAYKYQHCTMLQLIPLSAVARMSDNHRPIKNLCYKHFVHYHVPNPAGRAWVIIQYQSSTHRHMFRTKPVSARGASQSWQWKQSGCQEVFIALITRPITNSPHLLQHGAYRTWKSCSQYFRPSNCK